MRRLCALGWIAGLAVLAACKDPLNVTNVNAPDRTRVLSQPSDLEQFVINSWAAYHDAIYGANDALQPQLLVAGLENFAELANFGMNLRVSIPRNFIDNSRGNPVQGGNYRDFLRLSRAARSAALGLAQLAQPGFSIGTPEQDARAKAFARFVLGVSLGTLALAYDSAAIITPQDDPEAVPPLKSYKEVSAAGLANLDTAIAIAQATPAAFPLPTTWLNTPSTVSQADFIRIVRSFRARLRAAVARDPTERAAVDWDAIIADAENGITADFQIMEDPSKGFSIAWFVQHFVPGGWHRMHQFMIGFADTTGAFDQWLATPRANRSMFLIQTPDRRFPRGATRTAQQSGTAVLPPGQYFRNRPPGDDVIGDPLGNSMYDHYRFRAFYNASRIGPFPVLTKAEVDLLAAEGYIRKSQFPQAMAKINPTRVAAGLPPLVGITSLNDPVPGGAGCVPRVPQPPSFTSTACGNIWEAMKWEKRMETAYTGYGNWFFDSRGWGDLPEGTAVHWPVPYQEMDTRRQPFYNLGGCGGTAASGKSTYGLNCTS
jgi:hypothetical protein